MSFARARAFGEAEEFRAVQAAGRTVSGSVIVGLAGGAVILAGLVVLGLMVRKGPVFPDTRYPTCGACGHRQTEHNGDGGPCRVETGGGRERYDGGGNWVGWWNPTYCRCSGFARSGTKDYGA